METMYGEGSQATFFIALAYITGAALLSGYAIWLWLDRRQVLAMKKILDQESKNGN